ARMSYLTIDPSTKYRNVPVYTVPAPVRVKINSNPSVPSQMAALLDAMARRILVGMGVL
ncbi:hypothetical protein FS837_002972, partial [Tulasnella sp. UAMH 9824]